MKKNILIPTDFSPNAFNSVLYAIELFRDQECTFHIYHTYYLPTSKKGNLLIPDSLEYKKAKQNTEEEMELLKIKVSPFVNSEKQLLLFDFEYGFFLDLMELKVQKENVDLIIMGTRGATDDKKITYGRNTIDVMEKVQHCPVMGIPPNVKIEDLNEIVFPTSFKGEWNLKELNVFLDIAKIANAQIRILHIGNEVDLSEIQREYKSQLEILLSSSEHSFHWLQNVSIADGLLLFVKQRQSGLIAFVNRKHWFFGSIFSSPLIKTLSLHATIPLLALHNPSK